MKPERGAALIVALLLLSFLTILGGALLTNSTLDVKITDNYKLSAQLLYLAEGGIDRAREDLRTSTSTLTTLLTTAAGSDGVLSTATELSTLRTSDVPYIDNATLTDASGRLVGRYSVFLRNDRADGRTSPTDTNEVISLLTIATNGNARKMLEVEVRKGRFPKITAAVTLNGPVASFDPGNANNLEVRGNDHATSPGAAVHAIGVLSTADDNAVTAAIAGPPDRSANYTGAGAVPPPADVVDISTQRDARLTTPPAVERIVESFKALATRSTCPGTADVGTAGNPAIVVIDGNCDYGPATGYGILVARGELTMNGNSSWNGLILVIGQGVLRGNTGSHTINGGIFLAKTRATPSDQPPLGPILGTLGPVSINISGSSSILYNTTRIRDAEKRLPFTPISYREY